MAFVVVRRPTLTHLQLDKLGAVRDRLRNCAASTGQAGRLSQVEAARLASEITQVITMALQQEQEIVVEAARPTMANLPVSKRHVCEDQE